MRRHHECEEIGDVEKARRALAADREHREQEDEGDRREAIKAGEEDERHHSQPEGWFQSARTLPSTPRISTAPASPRAPPTARTLPSSGAAPAGRRGSRRACCADHPQLQAKGRAGHHEVDGDHRDEPNDEAPADPRAEQFRQPVGDRQRAGLRHRRSRSRKTSLTRTWPATCQGRSSSACDDLVDALVGAQQRRQQRPDRADQAPRSRPGSSLPRQAWRRPRLGP